MVASLNKGTNVPNDFAAKAEESIPRVDFFVSKGKEDPFHEESFSDPVSSCQHAEIITEIEVMVSRAAENSLDRLNFGRLRRIFKKHTVIFRVGL